MDPCAVLIDMVSDSTESTTRQLAEFVSDKQVQRSWPNRVIHLLSPSSEIPGDCRRTQCALVGHLFDAKNRLDADDVMDFVVVTSRLMKKFLERLCYVLFSHVHNWCVVGVDVSGQDVALRVPSERDVEVNVRNFLRSVKAPDEVEVLRADVFPENMFNAGFSTRTGGVSSLGPLASLNLVHTIRKPDPEVVIEENRRRLALKAGFELKPFSIAKVEHGTKIWVVEKTTEKPAKFDGVVTNTPGVTVAAPGADCCVILLADPNTGACGAVHAGWMGTTKGAVRSLLRTMVEEYGTRPCDVLAAIGPSLEAECFSLSVDDAQPIKNLEPSLVWPHKSTAGLCHMELVRSNALLLQLDGVCPQNIDLDLATCTACSRDLFYSHRRDGVPFGNQIGFIQRREQPVVSRDGT